jgi:hypothetical protein
VNHFSKTNAVIEYMLGRLRKFVIIRQVIEMNSSCEMVQIEHSGYSVLHEILELTWYQTAA